MACGGKTSVNGMSVKQCAQCGANLIAAEWSEHLSDHCVRNVWSCDACGYQFEDTVLRERRRTHHKAPSNPAAWRYCWFSVIAGKPGNAQTFIPGISYNPHRILEGWGV